MKTSSLVVAGWGLVLAVVACGDSGDAAGGAAPGGSSTGGSSSGGAGAAPLGGGGAGGQDCEAALESSFFSAHCLDCIEAACCGASAACEADPVCVACVDDSSSEGCASNAAVLDLLGCAQSSCVAACGDCFTCGCTDDGVCDARFGGAEVCSCPDCVADPAPVCLGACVVDGECSLNPDEPSDACTCADCEAETFCMTCNLDGFCDTWFENCDCVDCVANDACG